MWVRYRVAGVPWRCIGFSAPRAGRRGPSAGGFRGYAHPVRSRKQSRKQLDALVEQATVDCYNDDEQLTGLYTMIEDNLVIPFSTRILGVDVTVEDVDLRGNGIVAICSRGTVRQAVPILELPLPTPPPDGAEWIEAYRHWAA
jgi:hypothetical protein